MKRILPIIFFVASFKVISQNGIQPIQLLRCDSADFGKIIIAYESINALLTANATECMSDKESKKKFLNCDDCILTNLENNGLFRGGCFFENVNKARIGKYSNGRLTDVEGKIIWGDGRFFIGRFKKGEPQDGLLIEGEDRYYTGEIKDNKPHGKGKLFQNGSSFEGTWDEGVNSSVKELKTSIRRLREPEPNCVCNKSLISELEPILNRNTLIEILNEDDYDPTIGDFQLIFPNPPDKFYTSYITRYKEHIKKNEGNFKLYSKKHVAFECTTFSKIKSNSRTLSTQFRQEFYQEKDCVIKVSYFKKGTLETYDVFFYKIRNTFKILQLQLLYD